ncbi:MAG: PEGA domain-containing protein [Treponema sp.]|nr:PEGA domain-containing protein [Treponema sp.]
MIGQKLIEHIRRGFSCRAFILAAFFAAAFVLASGLSSCASASSQRNAQGQEGEENLQERKAARETAEQLAADEFFKPERFEEMLPGLSAATFKTSKPKCALYVNGEYHGLTPLKLAGLVPGRYAVQIKREGYKIVNITIQVKDGISDYYYIEMETDQASAAGSNDLDLPITLPQSQ